MPDITNSRTNYSLIERLGGQPDARDWETFVRCYAPQILTWCRQQGFQEDDAADVAQNVMLKMIEKVRSYHPDKGKFRPWLKTVTKNAWIDFVRQRAKEVRGSGSTEVKDQLDNISADSLADHVDMEFEGDLLAEAMRRVEPRVGPDNWAIFYLLTFDGCSAAEVATRYNKNIAAIWKVRSRVKALLQKEIQDLGWSDAE